MRQSNAQLYGRGAGPGPNQSATILSVKVSKNEKSMEQAEGRRDRRRPGDQQLRVCRAEEVTHPGRGYFLGVQFYSPTLAFFDQTWKPDNIEKVKGEFK